MLWGERNREGLRNRRFRVKNSSRTTGTRENKWEKISQIKDLKDLKDLFGSFLINKEKPQVLFWTQFSQLSECHHPQTSP